MSKKINLQFGYDELNRMRRYIESSSEKNPIWSSLSSLYNVATGSINQADLSLDQQNDLLKLSEIDRRKLLTWLSGIATLLTSSACTRQPPEYIVPYDRSPEHIIPGKPTFYASALPFCGYGIGVLVETHFGRPTKVEGNKNHPASLGSTDAFMQAATLSLYDPDRAKAITKHTKISTWQQFKTELQKVLSTGNKEDASFRILAPHSTSPTLRSIISNLGKKNRNIKWHQFDSISYENTRNGSNLAFGKDVDIYFNIENADVIVSFDADLFSLFPGKLLYARQFSKRRDVSKDNVNMSRFYAVYSAPSITSSMADHKLPVKPSEIKYLLFEVAGRLGITPKPETTFSKRYEPWLDAVVDDLTSAFGRSLVVVDETQPPEVHALVHLINSQLGNYGKTIFAMETERNIPPELDGGSVATLTEDMHQGKVEGIMILSSNPAYDVPVDIDFTKALKKVPFKAQLSTFHDETTFYCDWHIPEKHPFESWGDVRAFDGTISLMQPTISPLYVSRSVIEMVAAVADKSPMSDHDLLYDYWKNRIGKQLFDKEFQKWLRLGIIPDSQYPVLASMPVDSSKVVTKILTLLNKNREHTKIELIIKPDPSVWDGRFSNNAWLQELPKPLNAISWDNVAAVSPNFAAIRDLKNEDMVELKVGNNTIEAPIWVIPGHDDSSVTITLGYGRSSGGSLAKGVGYHAGKLRLQDALWHNSAVTVRKTGKTYSLASADEQLMTGNRDVIKTASLVKFIEKQDTLFKPEFSEDKFQPTIPTDPKKFPPKGDSGASWGMSIDLNKCIGCNACVVACQAENNVPVVGKENVAMGRRMHWLRIDHYHSGDFDNPDSTFQPVPCMHCEAAPCEVVCPVNATVHSRDGLNQMVYNRCVGTRYCSNNCPYKVRRFNFYDYNDPRPEIKCVRNPDVTVRSRGVMEKCTYCVQRIQSTNLEADEKGVKLPPDAIQTACQQACPTQAIVFGNISDPRWKVSKQKQSPRNYELLGSLHTKPRTTYLAKIKNLASRFMNSSKEQGEDKSSG